MLKEGVCWNEDDNESRYSLSSLDMCKCVCVCVYEIVKEYISLQRDCLKFISEAMLCCNNAHVSCLPTL